jgi:serine/threonine-protein kinase RsbW
MFRCAFGISSDTRYLRLLRQWLSVAVKLAGNDEFSKKDLGACSLAMVEAVDNAIFHAHGRKREIPIRVSLSIGNGSIVIEVVDCGHGLGRHKCIRPDDMSDHGRGLFLIHKLMSRVESRMRNGRHVLRMVYNTNDHTI